MDKNRIKSQKRSRRRAKIRSQIKGTGNCPRLSVFRSNKGMYLQLVDDENGKTLASAGSRGEKSRKNKTEQAFLLGKMLASKAKEAKINKAVFDRGGYKYHGRVKAAAEGAREGGLKF